MNAAISFHIHFINGLQVPGIGAKAFQQCAGFIMIPQSPQPFDTTIVHPESYELALQLCNALKLDPLTLKRRQQWLESAVPVLQAQTSDLKVRVPTECVLYM